MIRRARRGERVAVAWPGRRPPDAALARAGRALAAHQGWVAAGLLGLLVLVHLWPVLIGGRVLAPNALLYGFVPWSHDVPDDLPAYYNAVLSDTAVSYYPWDALVRRLLHAGAFPAWNPYALGGTPLFGNASIALFSPFSLPLWLLPLHAGLGLAAALKLWAAGFGTYLLARELRLGFWPGLLAAVSFSLCAFNVVWLSHGAHVSVAALLPWTLWLVERIVRRGRSADGLALAAVVVLVLTGGHPGTQLHVLSAAVLYALVHVVLQRDLARRARWERLGLVAAGLVVGTLTSAIALLPAVVAADDAIGAAVRRNGATGLPGATMPLDVARTLLFPEWWGRPSEQIVAGPANFNERAFFAGTIALVLALAGLLAGGGWRRKAPFALLGAIGLAAALDAPLVRPLIDQLPPFDRVQNQRLLLWPALAIAILGAFGLQALLDAPRRQRRTWIALGAAALAALLAALSVADPGAVAEPALDAFLDRRADDASDGSLALASVGWCLVALAALAGLLLLARRRPRAALLGGLVVLLVAAEMLRFADGYQPMAPADDVNPPRTPAVAFLQREAGDARIVGVADALPADFSTVYGLRDVRGYDAPQPSRRFFRLWRMLNPRQQAWTPFSLPTLDARGLRVLGVLGTRYVVAAPGMELPRAPGFASSSIVYRGPDATILANGLAAPRAYAARRVRIVPDDAAELAAVTRAGFDPRGEVVVRADELGMGASSPSLHRPGRVRVVQERNAGVTLRATLPDGGVVVLSDAWAPGWTVEVDGRRAEPLQANVVARGVAVPAGTHEIEWSYRPPGLWVSAALSGLGLLAFAGWGTQLAIRRRRRR